MTILEKIKFEEDWLSEVNLTKENMKIALEGIRATVREQQPCEDAISREEALKYSHIEYDDDGVGHRVIYTEDIEELPPVQPQRPKGKWIDAGFDYECTNCKAEINAEIYYMSESEIKYCPYCGIKLIQTTKMREEDKE